MGAVICGPVTDCGSRTLSLVRAVSESGGLVDPASVSVEAGLADVVMLQRRRQARISAFDEESFFLDTLSEYQWARDAAGLAQATLDGLVKPVIEVCEFYGTAPWQLSSREVDRYLAGPGKRAQSTMRAKIGKIDGYFAFLEQRYAGEIMSRFGVIVESPIDLFNRPCHRGDFGLRVPPSQVSLKAFFGRWREDLPRARKYLVACCDYVMTKIAYLSGVRAAELCGVCMGDLHWENGQWAVSSCWARERAVRVPGRGRRTCSRRAGPCCGGTSSRSGASSETMPAIRRHRCGRRSASLRRSRR